MTQKRYIGRSFMASRLRKLGTLGIGFVLIISLGIAIAANAAPMGTHEGMQASGVDCPYAQDGEGMCPSAPLHLALLENEAAREIAPKIMLLFPVILFALLFKPRRRTLELRWREIFSRNALLKGIDRFLLAFAQGLLKPKRPQAVLA